MRLLKTLLSRFADTRLADMYIMVRILEHLPESWFDQADLPGEINL